MADNITSEYGIFSPPAALPNPTDLSNGQHGANLRFGVVNLATDEGMKRFSQVLGWFKTFDAPVDDYTFYTPVNSGQSGPGFGSTQIIFADAQGRRCVFDATQMLNSPESHLTALLLTFGLPVRPGTGTFPGFDVIDHNEQAEPVGEPLPALNTPGWRRPFARYYGVSSVFSAEKHPLGSRFLRIGADEEFVRAEKIFGWKPNPAGFGMRVDVRPVWERVR